MGRFFATMQVIEVSTETVNQLDDVSSKIQIKGELEMKLRPHLLLCIQKVTSHGYNADFISHMKSIVSELTENAKTPITVAQRCDELCKMCPNNISGVCNSLEKVYSMDSAVLSVCNLDYKDNAAWAELSSIARERILGTDDFNKICSCCQWFELCRGAEVYYG